MSRMSNKEMEQATSLTRDVDCNHDDDGFHTLTKYLFLTFYVAIRYSYTNFVL